MARGRYAGGQAHQLQLAAAGMRLAHMCLPVTFARVASPSITRLSCMVCAQHGWCIGTICSRYVDDDDDVTFHVRYDEGDAGDHVLDADKYAWGHGAPWSSWCLLEEAGTVQPAPGEGGGAFTQWAQTQPAVSAEEGGSAGLSPLHDLAERWLGLPWSERETLLNVLGGSASGGSTSGSSTSNARQERQGRTKRTRKRGGVLGRKRDSGGVPAAALQSDILPEAAATTASARSPFLV